MSVEGIWEWQEDVEIELTINGLWASMSCQDKSPIWWTIQCPKTKLDVCRDMTRKTKKNSGGQFFAAIESSDME